VKWGGRWGIEKKQYRAAVHIVFQLHDSLLLAGYFFGAVRVDELQWRELCGRPTNKRRVARTEKERFVCL
jgi:hypothetical protein